eukprot:8214683-Lingulodinium_polyedra.AAC.1
MDGVTAWQSLKKNYDRKTLAKSLRRYRAVVHPKQVKETSEITKAIVKWEADVLELKRTEKETLPPMIRLAGLTEICTDEVRDMIYQN